MEDRDEDLVEVEDQYESLVEYEYDTYMRVKQNEN